MTVDVNLLWKVSSLLMQLCLVTTEMALVLIFRVLMFDPVFLMTSHSRSVQQHLPDDSDDQDEALSNNPNWIHQPNDSDDPHEEKTMKAGTQRKVQHSHPSFERILAASGHV
jgi:hypothetical protein